MRNLFFAALAALSFSVAVIPAYAATASSLNSATASQQANPYYDAN